MASGCGCPARWGEHYHHRTKNYSFQCKPVASQSSTVRKSAKSGSHGSCGVWFKSRAALKKHQQVVRDARKRTTRCDAAVSGILAGNLPFGCTRGRIEEEEKDMKELVLPEDGRWGLLALNLSKVSRALSQQKPCKCTNKLF